MVVTESGKERKYISKAIDDSRKLLSTPTELKQEKAYTEEDIRIAFNANYKTVEDCIKQINLLKSLKQ